MSRRIYRLLKPIIAAINGPAVGVGMTMTLPMDIRIASKTAKMGMVFARRGIVPEACSTWFLPRIVGINQAAEWVYSGRVFPATEALAGGYVRSLHKPDDLLPAANELAREIADNTSSITVALARQMMWRLLGADDPVEAHKLDSIRYGLDGETTGCARRRDLILGKESAGIPDEGEQRHAALFPMVGRTGTGPRQALTAIR